MIEGSGDSTVYETIASETNSAGWPVLTDGNPE